MKIGDLIEGHRGERGIILDIELIYPGHPRSPPRAALIYWMNEVPLYHVEGRYTHISAVKKVLSHASR